MTANNAHPLRRLLNQVSSHVKDRHEIDGSKLFGILFSCDEIKGWTRQDTYWNILGRLPENFALFGNYRSEIERVQNVWDCLLSEELRPKIIERLIAVFPEKPKIIFIHVPRTAGTSVRSYIQQHARVYVWDAVFENTALWDRFEQSNDFFLSYPDLLAKLLVQSADIYQIPLVITGHFSLDQLIKRNLVAPHDKCFAGLRDPAEIVISLLKYYLQTARHNPDRVDGAEWRKWIATIDPNWFSKSVPSRELISRMLKSERFYNECSNLVVKAFSNAGNIDEAFECVKLTNCQLFEMSDIPKLEGYVQTLFGVSSVFPLENATSRLPFDITTDEMDYINNVLINKDRVLWDMLQAK